MSVLHFSSDDAYLKVMLHCLKYPACAVSGILVGKKLSQEASPSQDPTTYFVVDAIPCFHNGILVAPWAMLEVVVLQVAALVRTKGLAILGMYCAADRKMLSDAPLHPGVLKALYLLSERNIPQLILWKVLSSTVGENNRSALSVELISRLSKSNDIVHCTTEPLMLRFGTWSEQQCCPTGPDDNESTSRKAAEIVSQDKFSVSELFDFEEHLENLDKDYFNSNITLTKVKN